MATARLFSKPLQCVHVSVVAHGSLIMKTDKSNLLIVLKIADTQEQMNRLTSFVLNKNKEKKITIFLLKIGIISVVKLQYIVMALLLQILSYIHHQKKQRGADEMLCRLYEPILWRSLRVRYYMFGVLFYSI